VSSAGEEDLGLVHGDNQAVFEHTIIHLYT